MKKIIIILIIIKGCQLGIDDNEESDHGVCLEDPNIIDYQKHLGWCLVMIVFVRGIGHADALLLCTNVLDILTVLTIILV